MKIPGMRDRIKAAYLLVAIGDALGMSVETFTEDEINKHLKKLGIPGRLTTYLRPDGHKWFDGCEAGSITDDWLFTKITIESLIRMNGFNMDDMAKAHADPLVKDYLKNFGAGKATREALKNLSEGVHWSQSGIKGSAGNGISMKIAGIAAYMEAEYLRIVKENNETDAVKKYDEFWKKMMRNIYDYTLMTHNSKMALASAYVQVRLIMYCLGRDETDRFYHLDFIYHMVEGALIAEGRIKGEEIVGDNLHNDKSEERLSVKMLELYKDFTAGRLRDAAYIISKYGGKPTGYIMNSIPLSYAFLLKNHCSIDALYDIVNAGGDTDTNAAIAGPIIGALGGTKIIPQHLLDGLSVREEVEKLANDFCDKFGIID